jgi:hypothetical protein
VVRKIYVGARSGMSDARRLLKSWERKYLGPTGKVVTVCRSVGSTRHLHQRQSFRYNQDLRWLYRVAPLAQLDRASGYEPEGREFESLRAHHSLNLVHSKNIQPKNKTSQTRSESWDESLEQVPPPRNCSRPG